ncbi:ATP-binding cassette domain-containing protein [uncultured Anaerococcus sp.]|uniref:ATP-binding cassette domain-containing protein n=1 Tax=uncultured Anaerococcus sp. TaxID=293428 RepID=UPI002632BC04|nr:ATP-binding cassette domain-containing protein [uncultured Anaerococcus sp.]
MIEIRNLSKSFGDRSLFTNININFYDNMTYSIVGESGSGKTTLLNIIAKLEEKDSGKIVYDSTNLDKINEHKYFRDYLGYLFQNLGLIESESVDSNLELAFVGKKLSKGEKLRLKKVALEKVNLSHIKLDTKVYTLSGGESQRVALSKLILKDPPIILADEPTASVDLINAEEILNILLSMKRKGRIIIIATHSKGIWQATDEIISMDEIKN